MDAADDSPGPTVEQCEMQIAALAGRIDAETESRSAVAKELSSTVASQLAAMRTVLESVGAMRSAIEALSRDVAAVAEKEAADPAVNDDRIAAFADGLRGEIGVVRDAVEAVRTDLGHVMAELGGVHDALVTIRADVAALQGTVAGTHAGLEAVRERVAGVCDHFASVQQESAALRNDVQALCTDVGTIRRDVARLEEDLQTNTMLHEEVRHLAQRMDEIMSLLAARPDAWSSSQPARDRPVVALVEDSVALFREALTSIPGGRLLWALLELPFVTAAAVMRMVRVTAEPDA